MKLDILLAGDPVDALSLITPRERAHIRGKTLVAELRQKIPRFEVAVQAAIGNKVVARETISGEAQEDVLAKCYGGDITRKRKLLEKQKEVRGAMDEQPRRRRGAAGGLPRRARARPGRAGAVGGPAGQRGGPGRPRLDRPDVAFHASFLAALEEYHAEGHHLELPAAALADPAEFARYVAALRADVGRPGGAGPVCRGAHRLRAADAARRGLLATDHAVVGARS